MDLGMIHNKLWGIQCGQGEFLRFIFIVFSYAYAYACVSVYVFVHLRTGVLGDQGP